MFKKNKTYYFVNLEIFPIAKYVFLFWIFFSFNAFITKFPYYLTGSFLILLFFGLYVLFRTGAIHQISSNDEHYVQIKDVFKSIRLDLPLTYESWWSYDFEDGEHLGAMETGGRMKAGANNIISYLWVTDINANQVLFKEKIFLDVRFPNEAPHAIKNIDKTIPQFKVQRTDKLTSFITALNKL